MALAENVIALLVINSYILSSQLIKCSRDYS